MKKLKSRVGIYFKQNIFNKANAFPHAKMIVKNENN